GHPPAGPAVRGPLPPGARLARRRGPAVAGLAPHDTNVPVGESRQFVRAARERGLDAELLMLREEGHDFRRADNRRLFRRSAADWIQRHLAT
ncbi:prolyl oligopeptidase family serine peptidase, partial [Streptomyces sp900105245]|uniref:alpha/beta hydrolase family protein n=1 Tax=Streptomyces sp. 900105245 TaxID=3154379 RepID=UPI0033346A08